MNTNITNPDADESLVTVRPPYRSCEDEHGVTLAVALPGVVRDRLTVTFHEDRLVVEAERPTAVPEGWRMVRGSSDPLRYRLALRLSNRLDGEHIEANLSDGVLTLRLPLREEARPRRIEVA